MQTSTLLVAGALALGGCASSQASRQPTTAQPEARRPAAQQAPGMHEAHHPEGGD